MQKNLFLLLVFSCSFGFSQETPITYRQAQKKAYDYVLKNLKDLKEETKEKAIYVKVFFNEKDNLKKILYYSFKSELSSEEYDKEPEVEIPVGLSSTISSYFSFIRLNFFNNGKQTVETYAFVIPFSEKELKDAIAYDEKYLIKNNEISYNIRQNSPFHLKINSLAFLNTNEPAKIIKGKLDILSSGMLQLSQNNLYFIFRIINTSHFFYDKEVPITYLEYKLYYKFGSSLEEVGYSRLEVNNKKVNFTEEDNDTFYGGATDILQNIDYCEKEDQSVDAGNTLRGLKFNFDIQFE